MSDTSQRALMIAYGFGVVVDWGFWIASYERPSDEFGAVVFGWLPALFWPLHVAYGVWEAVL